MENMINRLFSHISSDESILDQRNNEHSANQQPKKGEEQKTRIQLNMRKPYAQHVKETLKLPEV